MSYACYNGDNWNRKGSVNAAMTGKRGTCQETLLKTP